MKYKCELKDCDGTCKKPKDGRGRVLMDKRCKTCRVCLWSVERPLLRNGGSRSIAPDCAYNEGWYVFCTRCFKLKKASEGEGEEKGEGEEREKSVKKQRAKTSSKYPAVDALMAESSSQRVTRQLEEVQLEMENDAFYGSSDSEGSGFVLHSSDLRKQHGVECRVAEELNEAAEHLEELESELQEAQKDWEEATKKWKISKERKDSAKAVVARLKDRVVEKKDDFDSLKDRCESSLKEAKSGNFPTAYSSSVSASSVHLTLCLICYAIQYIYACIVLIVRNECHSRYI
jgi:hypothetical protein